ncbi:MAG TPA: alpha/beta hydrolase [Trebonia sp.]|nr:alpha/beta hydrolase [Trebonia sp.]
MNATTSLIDAELLGAEAANGISYAYRRFGNAAAGVPVVFLQHFRGNIDNWDPALVDAVAADREVILFDNVGVGATSGTTPGTVEEMARDAVVFLDALGLSEVDLFGFSLGGFVAQEIALTRPGLVRRLILAGTGPKGAPGMQEWSPDVVKSVVADDISPEGYVYVFYAHTDSSRGAGQASLGRIYQRQEGRDEGPSLESKNAQYRAVLAWGVQDWASVGRLRDISQPTLILQGDDDIMIPTAASHTLAGLIPNAKLTIYPDASHGSIFQYAAEAARETAAFLSDCPRHAVGV